MPRVKLVPAGAAVPVCPAVFGLLLGLWGLTHDTSMWRDEAATWQAAHRSVPELCRLLEHADVVHGLYYLFMHGVFALFGDSLVALRLPSVLAMSGAAALVAVLGTRLTGGTVTGLAAGLAFCLLPAVQEYAQEGRPYALVMAFSALSCLLFVRALDRPGAAGRWTAYGAAVLLAALLNWFALLVLTAHAGTLALVRPPRATVLRWAAASGAAVAGTLPLIAASAGQTAQVDWIRPAGPGTLLVLLLTFAGGAVCARTATKAARGPAGPASGTGRPPTLGRPHPHRPRLPHLSLSRLALPLLVLPPLVLLAGSLLRPVYLTRYVLFGHLGLALLIGGACHALTHRLRTPPHRTVAAVAGLAFLGLLPVQLSLRGADGRIDDVLVTAAHVAAVSEPGDAVLYIPSARRDTALVSPTGFTGLRDLALARGPLESGTLNGVEAGPERIAGAMLSARRIVVVSDAGPPTAPTARDRAKRRVLEDRFVRRAQTTARGRTVTVYERRGG
ncbi:glycosyltransferase family 39 protein [Streptomyces sp. NPDC057682]|uniref:glycosyltransferase family 39 protein n=1 Tax=Streptomyces sp. NPDC057682 TaxID=3346210 RepID=UPI00369F1D1D